MEKVSSRNVVLIVLDSVRKDFFEEYAPRIQEHADLSYSACRAASSWSLPSHASMLSGVLPSEHDVHTHTGNFQPLSISDTFLADLDEHTTVGVSANAFASSSYGFDRYFDIFFEPTDTRRYPAGFDPGAITQQIGNDNPRRYIEGIKAIIRHDHPLASIANAVIGEVDNLLRELPIQQVVDDGAKPVLRTSKNQLQTVDEPFFAFLNIMDGHIPHRPNRLFDNSLYNVPADWSSDQKGTWELMNTEATKYWDYREQVYAATIDYMDRQLVSFVDWLDKETQQPTTVIVTADHGENHGRPEEHGLVNHKSSLSEGLLHVPFEIINPPSGETTTDQYISHLQLGTLIEGFANDELVDISRETVAAEHIGLSAGTDPPEQYDYWDRAMRAAYNGSEKYVWDSLENTNSYYIDSDRPSFQEERPADSELPEWAIEQFNSDILTYKQQAKRTAKEAKIDQITKQRLEKLGYR